MTSGVGCFDVTAVSHPAVTRGERGQVTVAAVGHRVAVLLGMVVLVHLAAIRSGGARGQTAADVAALAGVRVLAANPDGVAASVRAGGRPRGLAANGARVEALPDRVRRQAFPRRSTSPVSELVTGAVPGVGRRADRVRSWSRAGVTYTATLASASFRPVDLAGAHGAAAVVAAAEAQIGWPYVWGGESRAEGGFDCSGLVDYAYGAAGMCACPGRPTAADLWHMSRHVSEAELAPGDLVFLGSGHRRALPRRYVRGRGHDGGGASHRRSVSYERLIDNPWDGFGRLLSGPPAADPVASGVEAAARRYDVPPDVVSAELHARTRHQSLPGRDALLARDDGARSQRSDAGADRSAREATPPTAALVMRNGGRPSARCGLPGHDQAPAATASTRPSSIDRCRRAPAAAARASLISTGSSAVESGAATAIQGRDGGCPSISATVAISGSTRCRHFPIGPRRRSLRSPRRAATSATGGSSLRKRGPSRPAGGLLGAPACDLVQALIAGYGLYRARTWRGRLYNGGDAGRRGLAGAWLRRRASGPQVAARRFLAAAIVITAGATIYANWDTLDQRKSSRADLAGARSTQRSSTVRLRRILHLASE